MQKAAPAHETFARVLAVDHAVKATEVFVAIAFAVAGPAELAGVGQRVLDAGGR